MNTHRFDPIARSLTVLPSRRDVLRGLVGAGLGPALLGWPRGESMVAAKNKRKQKHKPKQQTPLPPSPPPAPFNQFGCLDVGQPCQGDSTLCCSGICEPTTSRCIAHNSGVCSASTDTCTLRENIPCNPNKEGCLCTLTTSNAGFCADFSDAAAGERSNLCRFCSQDTDCQEEFGPGAACVVLAGACTGICLRTGTTACMRSCA